MVPTGSQSVSGDIKHILVYNPLSGHGHLDAWNALFVKALLDLGFSVAVLTPNPIILIERLRTADTYPSSSLTILNWNASKPSLIHRVFNRIKRVFRRYATTEQKDLEANYLEPTEFARRVNYVMRRNRRVPDLLINMYMDLYRTDVERWQKVIFHTKLSWVGIRFAPRSAPHEGYYSLPSLAGMCFLDEDVCRHYSKVLPNKQFVYIPDIVDDKMPCISSVLTQEIRKKAGVRKIIFLGGTIGGQKNLSSWLELRRYLSSDEWYFVLVGEVNYATLMDADKKALAEISANPPSNLYFYDRYVEDEKAFNEIISIASVIFAVYRDFKISSNMLGKAAAFNVPIIVADRYLMARRVLKYGIGTVANQNDVALMADCIRQLTASPPALECFESYRRDFSTLVLGTQLSRLVSNSPNVKSSMSGQQ